MLNLGSSIELTTFSALVNGVRCVFDGQGFSLALDDGSPLTPEQAVALLDTLSWKLREETGPFANTALTVATSKAAASVDIHTPNPVSDNLPEKAPAPLGGGDWRPSIAIEKPTEAEEPAPPSKAETAEVAPEPTPEAPPAPALDGDVPAALLEAKRVKEVVAYYLDQGLDPDGVWAACAPLVRQVPALKRLRNAEERVKRVAIAFHGA